MSGLIGKLSGAPRAVIVRLAGRGLSFVATLVLANILTTSGYGVYAYATAWVAVLIVPASIGIDQLLLRHVAVYSGRETPALIRGLIRRSEQSIFLLSLAVAALAAVAAFFFVESVYLDVLLIALLALPLRAMTKIGEGILQGLGRPELSFVPTFVILPLSLLIVVPALAWSGVDVTATTAIAVFVGSAVLGLAFAHGMSRRLVRPVVADAEIEFDTRYWAKALVPFTAITGINALSVQAGVLMLGSFGTPDDVGVFQVVLRLAEPTVLLMLAINVAVAPQIAGLHEAGDLDGIRDRAQQASRNSLLTSLPIALFLILSATWVLGLFGSGMEVGATALTIVILAQVFYAFTGVVNIALLMTGLGNYVVWANGAGLLLDLLLCAILIPRMGLVGAAIARAADIVLSNTILIVLGWRKMGVNCTASPWPRGPRRPAGSG